MGLEDTPPPSPHQCAKALSVISVKVVVRGRSISKSNCTQRILRSWQKRVECPSPPPHTHTHTLLLHYLRPQESILHHVNVM